MIRNAGLFFRLLVMTLVAGAGFVNEQCCYADVLSLLNPELASLRRKQAEVQRELNQLGPMEMGTTCEEVGSQFHMVESPPTVSPWVQLDLGYSRRFDSIMVVPAVTASSDSREAVFAFPPEFRIDASDDADFSRATLLYRTSEEEIRHPLGIPIVVQTRGKKSRYVRLTVTRLASISGRWTYALGEILVLHDKRNIAIESKVEMSRSPSLPPKWVDDNLIDGRTPLGAPIQKELPEKDGVYTARGANAEDKWMVLDLGTTRSIDEIRLYPIYARQGANLPGYAFPRRLRVEVSVDEFFSEPLVVFNSGEMPFSNPGDNPVTFPVGGRQARYVRVVCVEAWSQLPDKRFGLSELQVYSGGANVAFAAKATIPGDMGDRPASMLTDGYDSLGHLIELPDWVNKWDHYRQLRLAIIRNEVKLRDADEVARRRLAWSSGAAGLVALAVGMLGLWTRRRHRQREQSVFRDRLARDLHDEIGSNLAAIARLGEVALLEPSTEQASNDWKAVSQMANECTDSMRDTLWLLGARQERGGHLPDRLNRIAKRMLPHAEIHWQEELLDAYFSGNVEMNRELFLVFKEIIANVAKHSKATRLMVKLKITKNLLDLSIRDNGIGFTQSGVKGGMGIENIHRRIDKLGGTVEIDTVFDEGTNIRLRLPV